MVPPGIIRPGLEDTGMPSYSGGCHCGAIRFEVTGEIEELVRCNCSICSRTAYIHWEVPPGQFRLLTSDAAVANYQFGTRTSKNYFCRTCGISAFRRSRSAPERVDVNVRCLEGIDPEALETELFDGRNWEEAMQRLASRPERRESSRKEGG